MSRRTSLTVYAFGFAIYVFSFFLPAVEYARVSPPRMDGWLCALGAIMGLLEWPPQLDLVLIGLLNPLVLLRILTGAVAPGRCFSLAQSCLILAGIGASWWRISTDSIAILPGHPIWIVGIAVILFPELVHRIAGEATLQ